MNQLPAKHNGHQIEQRLIFSMPSPQEMHQLVDFCKLMASSPFYQKLGPGGVMAIYLTAKEYNLPFMACLNGGIHAVEGKAVFSGILINAMILDAGHTADLISLDDKGCKIRFIRGDRKNDKSYSPLEYEYTTEMARIAGYLTKNNWKSSLRDMLYNRCMTGGGRKHFPEVLMGILVDGELVGTNADGDIEPSSVAISCEKKAEEPALIEHVPADGYFDFALKYSLLINADGKPASRHMEYIVETCKNTKRHEIQIINAAIKNEEVFLNMFKKWEKIKYPQPKSMDELAQEIADSQ